MDGLLNNLAQLSSLMRRCAICRVHSGHWVKGQGQVGRRVVPAQPSSFYMGTILTG